MTPPFHTIRIGPFATAFQQQRVDDSFLADLDSYLLRELLPQVTIPYETTEGSLRASYDEDRYCGPRSVVRDIYAFEFQFLAADLVEELKAKLIYLPKERTFSIRYGKPLYLWTISRKRRSHDATRRIRELCQEILEGRTEPANCPVCGGATRIINADAMFDVTCLQRCFNYNFHRDPKTREFLHGHFFQKEPE